MFAEVLRRCWYLSIAAFDAIAIVVDRFSPQLGLFRERFGDRGSDAFAKIGDQRGLVVRRIITGQITGDETADTRIDFAQQPLLTLLDRMLQKDRNDRQHQAECGRIECDIQTALQPVDRGRAVGKVQSAQRLCNPDDGSQEAKHWNRPDNDPHQAE